jgi:predicted DNA repair protein MutK
MSTGLLALLDDVSAIAKVAAASVDDIAAHAGRAGAKAAGVVIDDAAVTPRYVVGFDASRELPIIGRIALGSLRNKFLILLPAALLLSAFAPWLITPLLLVGGIYLCFEGTEKVLEWIRPHAANPAVAAAAADALHLENERVAGAIKTDFILSAEIMAIALATMPAAGIWTQAAVLALVGLVITFGVYGVVALIVKADDMGVAMVRRGIAAGALLVRGMPLVLKLLSVVGTFAMIWVGGGIILHGLEAFGLGGPAHLAHGAGAALGGGIAGWLAEAAVAGIAGLVVGAAAIPLMTRLVLPMMGRSAAAH